MIVLDTNVLSALMREIPDAAVVAWLDRWPADAVWTTAITVMEVRTGLELLPVGRRRDALEAAFRLVIDEELQGRVLPLDRTAADTAGALAARQQRTGRPVEVRDVQIAGIAAARKATLVTRNIRLFEHAGIALVDPWAD